MVIDSFAALRHPRTVRSASGRLFGLLLSILTVSGHSIDCAGWLSSQSARMDCCADEQNCPMHRPGVRHATGNQSVSQDDADRCCAMSEQHQNGERVPSFAVAAEFTASDISIAAFALPQVRFLASRTAWAPDRLITPPPDTHLLHAVFLI